MIQLVKFECDCVGTEPDNNGNSVLVHCCDGEYNDPPLCFFVRDMSGKNYEDLSTEKTLEFVKAISDVLCLGFRMNELKTLIEFPAAIPYVKA